MNMFSSHSVSIYGVLVRYPSVPPMKDVTSAHTILAFDFMNMSFRDMLWAPAMTAPLSELFPPMDEEEQEGENGDRNEPGSSNADEKGKKRPVPGEFALKNCGCE